MSVEDRPGQGGDEQRELVHQPVPNELVVPQTRAIAQRVGFSPELFSRFLRINDTLKMLRPMPESITVVMTPGDSPAFAAGVDYSDAGYRAIVQGSRRHAAFIVETREQIMPRFMLRFPDIQSFIEDALPGRNVFLNGAASKPDIHDDEDESPFEKAPDFKVDIREVSEDQLRAITKIQEKRVERIVRGVSLPTIRGYTPYHEFKVEVEGQEKPFMELGYFTGRDPNGPVEELLAFPLHKLRLDGTAEEVEAFMDKVTQLFDLVNKHPLYPFTHYTEDPNYKPTEWDDSAIPIPEEDSESQR